MPIITIGLTGLHRRLRLGISCRDVLIKQAHPFPINVLCGVAVAIIMGATPAGPLTIGKREAEIDSPARAAGLRGRKEAPDRDQVLVLPLGFVCEHRSFVVKEIVTLHGGSINVKSQPEQR